MIGPNGAGKTTLFDLICGFTPASAGTITLNGRDITAIERGRPCGRGPRTQLPGRPPVPRHDRRRDAGRRSERWVGNRSASSPRCTCRWPSTTRNTSHCASDELIELMHLGDYRHSFVRELSTGTRRVVDLACLVAHRPAVILLDEPTSGIAQREVEALAPVLRRLRDEMGASLVVIEHDIPLVSSITDRLVALDQGRVVTTGPPADVLAHPDVIETYLGTAGAAIARSGGTE